MVRINVLYDEENIKKITLKGHALYGDYGNDIVCAAISATYLCTINAILSINSDAIKVLSNADEQVVSVVVTDVIVNKLLLNMLECLKSLAKQYPNNIKIK